MYKVQLLLVYYFYAYLLVVIIWFLSHLMQLRRVVDDDVYVLVKPYTMVLPTSEYGKHNECITFYNCLCMCIRDELEKI